MKVLYLLSSGGGAMRRSVRAAIRTAAPVHELRMLTPDSEGKALRDTGVPTESWRPAGLFNVLRAISVLRRAVDRYEPDGIHAFGWTAAAVALGALSTRYAARTLVTLQDPIRKNEMPKTFVEKRLPELLARSWAVECAYETLRRVLVDALNVPTDKVRVVPYGVEPLVGELSRPAGRPGPIVGFSGRLESDRAWEIAVDALAAVVKRNPDGRLLLGRTGPIAGLVRSHARVAGILDAVTFHNDLPLAELLAGIDMMIVPSSFDGLPYVVVESLVNGIPVIAADTGGIATTLEPFAAWLVPDDAAGFALGIEEAWSDIDKAWAGAQGQRSSAAAAFCAESLAQHQLAAYDSMSRERVHTTAHVGGS